MAGAGASRAPTATDGALAAVGNAPSGKAWAPRVGEKLAKVQRGEASDLKDDADDSDAERLRAARTASICERTAAMRDSYEAMGARL